MSRAALHVAAGLPALALRFLPPSGAAALALLLVAHNVLLLPRWAPRVMRPPGAKADVGVVTYPLVVLGWVLLFQDRPHVAAAGWAILAFGDGAAALAGQFLRGTRLPWNPAKRVIGTAAFFVAGTVAATAVGVFVSRGAPDPPWPRFATALAPVGAAALVAAFAESLPWRLDDNVRIALGSAAVFLAADGIDADRARDALDLAVQRAPLALAVGAAAGLAALKLRAVDAPGLAAGVVLGVILWGFGGPGAFATLAGLVAVGAASTRLGQARKEARGLAEAHEGRRSAAHALANVGLASGLAALGAMSTAGESLHLAMVAALATAGFDTVATEVGQAWTSKAYLLAGGRRVPPGTPGAVSLAGTLGGAAAALLVAIVAVATRLLPPQAVAIIVPAAAVGAFAESAIACAPAVASLVDHHGRNFLNTSVGALVAALLARPLAG